MSAKELDLDGFLGHTTRGPTTQFLDGWKQRDSKQVRIVLHTTAPIMAVWVHGWPKIVTRQKDGVEVREVWTGGFNSWEKEEVLSKQFQRESDGSRKFPPVMCPMSIMLEEVYQLWIKDHLEWDTALFRFVGDDESKAKTLHVAGMLGQANKIWEDLEEADRKRALKGGFPGPKEAWMENMQAKCHYIFTVVDYDNVGDGLQIARETTLVGDKMKKVIRDRMTSEGDDIGHPGKNPYVFVWEHRPDEKQFQDKYHVVPVGSNKAKISDAILDLVVDTPAPDISFHTKPGDIAALRASMEEAYIGPEGVLDFDFIFARAEEWERQQNPQSTEAAEDIADDILADDDDVADVDTDEEPEPAPAKPAGRAAKQTKAPEPEPEPAKPMRRRKAAEPAEDPRYVIVRREKDSEGNEECFAADGMALGACDCGVIMRADEDQCRVCGVQYEVDPKYRQAAEPEEEPEEIEEELEPEPAPTPARRVAKPATAPAQRPAPAATRPAPTQAATRPAPAQQAAPKPGPKPGKPAARTAPATEPAASTPRTAPKPAGAPAGNRVNGKPTPATNTEKAARRAGRDGLGF